MLLLLLNYIVLKALWKIDVYLISTLVNESIYYYYYHWLTLFLHPAIHVIYELCFFVFVDISCLLLKDSYK